MRAPAGETVREREGVCVCVCVPSPTLSLTDPVPRGLLTLCPGAY